MVLTINYWSLLKVKLQSISRLPILMPNTTNLIDATTI